MKNPFNNIPTIKLPPTIKTIMDFAMVAALLYTCYWLVTPQGYELMECRLYNPTIKLAQECAPQYDGHGILACVDQQTYIALNISSRLNLTEWVYNATRTTARRT